jgi:hypothetical protein
MKNEYERMKGLLLDLGFSFDEGSITNAEICSYAAGMQLVKDEMNEIFNKIFINIDKNTNVSNYCEMLDIDINNYDVDELKEKIFKRLGQQYGVLTKDMFDEAFKEVCDGEYDITNDGITISNVKVEDTKKLGKFIQQYMFSRSNIFCDGSGLDFDTWDKRGQTFHDYDSAKLPFNIIDTLRSDI